MYFTIFHFNSKFLIKVKFFSVLSEKGLYYHVVKNKKKFPPRKIDFSISGSIDFLKRGQKSRDHPRSGT